MELARAAAPRLTCYMPPSVRAELTHFTDVERLPPDMELEIHLQAPRRHDLQVPGLFLYELIEEHPNAHRPWAAGGRARRARGRAEQR
ncbi:MAG: PIN domain-containing protein [Arhodomonas sp.]|nr:PIN domain-containing protein [Arhodomonas sp.]